MCPYCDPNNMEPLDKSKPGFRYYHTAGYTKHDTWLTRESLSVLGDDTEPDAMSFTQIGIDQTGNYYLVTHAMDPYDNPIAHINYCPQCGRSLIATNN